jgi:hypothetical protein
VLVILDKGTIFQSVNWSDRHVCNTTGVGQVRTRCSAKGAPVQTALDAFPGKITLADLERACPGVGREMMRRVLRELQKAGKVVCSGRSPGAVWRRKGNISERE